MIEVSGLARSFDDVLAVDHLDVHVETGEILGLVGVNGAGKTTFLRMLAGILQPHEGRVRIAGEEVVGDGIEAKRHLAFVPDTPMLFDPLTVEEHLLFIARLYRVEDVEQRMQRVLETFELLDRRNSTAGSLSRGMRQKLAICCAFLHDPEVLLLDEPLTGLDPPGRRRMCDAIAERARQGSAVIVSSHQLEFVERLSDRFLIIHGGRKLLEGSLDEVRHLAGRDAGPVTLEDIFLRVMDDDNGPKSP